MTAALSLLTGPGAERLVRRVLAARGLPAGDVQRLRVHHRPGLDTTVSFAVRRGSERERMVLITDAPVTGRVVALEEEGVRLFGWLYPHDPRLPALASALEVDTLARWLAPDGVRPGEIGRPEVLAYRPLRRALVRVRVAGEQVFVKLWRPDKAADMVERHRLLDAAGVGPRIVGTPVPGVLIIRDAEGVPLAQRLAEWNAGMAVLPDPAGVARLLDRLPVGLLALPRRDAWADRLDFHGATAEAALPGRAGEIRRLVARIEAVLARGAVEAPVPTHGDFYEANVFVAGETFASLIDVDTAGPGRRVDDLACLLGHLAVLPDLSPAHYDRVDAVTLRWAAALESSCDAAQLQARTAAVILSLVAGTTPAHAVVRLDLAARWLHRAEQV